MATKTAKNKKDKSTIAIIKEKASTINKVALKTSSEFVDETIATGEQWQNLLAKTLKKGTHIFGKQQDMVLTGLEMLKDQYSYGNQRFKQLLTLKPSDSKKSKAAVKSEKSIDEVIKTAAKAEKASTQAKPKKTSSKKAAPVKNRTAATKQKAIPSTTAKKTKLTLIEGIGPKIQELLHNAGILNYDQLAETKPADLKKILTDAGTRYQMHDPSTWAAQAKLAAAEKLDELKVLQQELKGGK